MSNLSWSGRVAAAVTVCALSLAATAAMAQGTSGSSINGVVKDGSGGVLPGVTVTVTSPALIEQARTAVSDGEGKFQIVELRPGTYTVSFALQGFATLTKDGVQLTSNFTATVNGDMKVGDLSETLTVTGASPLVDVTRVTQQKVITTEDLATVPTAKSTLSLIALMPAAAAPPSAQDVGGSRGEASVRMSIHGARQTDQRMLQNGMSFNMLDNPTGRTFFMNPLAAAEVVVEAGSGGSAEYSTGGAQVNIISRDGANRYSGSFFAGGTGHSLQASNLSDDLKAKNLKSVNSVRGIYDFNAVVGGPIVKERLWFTTAHRRNGRRTRIANLFYDANPSDWVFTPDFNRPAEAPEDLRSDGVRFTYAATLKHKFWASYDWQNNDSLNQTGDLDSGTLAIEASERANAYCNDVNVLQGGWTFPLSNHLLFDAGISLMNNHYAVGFPEVMNCGGNPNNIRIVEQSTGFTYNGIVNRRDNIAAPMIMRGSSSYVTGAHNFKAGFDMLMTRRYVDYRERGAIGLPVSYRFNNGVPNRLTQYTTPLINPAFVRPSLGIFVQDSWSLNRLTISAGLRYEYLRAYSGEIDQPVGFPNSTAVHYDRVDCLPCWHDINPRVGVAWDLFGNGGTAVKGGVGRYVESLNSGYATDFGPGAGVVVNANRTWTDRNNDFFPDCDLRNLASNGECGALDNQAFGQAVVNTTPDAGFMSGFGKRQFNWQASFGVDHELRPGVALSATYYRRWFGNFVVTDNTRVTPSDYDPFCITAPTDARLGSISGTQICGLYDIKPAMFGQVANVRGLAEKFGNPTEVYNGFDLNLAARLGKGRITGGWNVGNTFVSGSAGGTTFSGTDNCFVVDSPQQLYNCKSENPYQHRIRFNGSYALPWDTQVAATFQNIPAANYAANFTVANAAIVPSLGRSLAGTTNITIDLLPLGSAYLEDRITQLDVRFSKMLRFGRRTIQTNVDLYNAFNASTVLQVNSTYGPNWLMPTQILDARLLKFSMQVDF